MSAVFQYESVLRKINGTWAEDEVRFLGNVISGVLSLGDLVSVPVAGDDSVTVAIARFTEDYSDDWCGLPFYDIVRPDSVGDAFCLCVVGTLLRGKTVEAPAWLVKIGK